MGEHINMQDGSRLAHVWYTYEGPYIEGMALENTDLNVLLNDALHKESIMTNTYYDKLTGLSEMTYFFEMAESGKNAMLRNTSEDAGETAGAPGKNNDPTILFMDLSGMKYYNQQYGFSEGNKLLKDFAKLLARYFDYDRCSRFGQDHFAVFTGGEGLESRLSALFADCEELNGGRSLPVRVGICAYSMGPVDVTTACDRAKLACDSLRDSYGSNYCRFSFSMRDKMQHQQYVVSNLDRAIREGWITAYYQPIVRAVNGRVCDEEALARWIDPEKGFFAPDEFIPILEKAGILWKLDLYMLDRVLEKLNMQRDAGLFLVPQSVNLSRSDFDACDMVEVIKEKVDAAGISRKMITIELTESVIGSDFDFMKKQVERFSELGFSVWMDDFGSGYSSLDILQSIKFNLIKFDMRFMRQLDSTENSRVVITELMRMAAALGTDTVCEGVETEEQVQFLREIGCSKIQGYYYQKPIPWEEVLKKYENGIQIGFEDPEESAYYEAIGRVNLYDLSVIAKDSDDEFQHYFSSLPMAVMEVKDDKVRFSRSNQPYREFMWRFFGFRLSYKDMDYRDIPSGSGKAFADMISSCCRNGSREFIDEKMEDGSTVHLFTKRLAHDPVTDTNAVVVVVLSVTGAGEGTNYEDIARALAADYFNLFYVDLKTEDFIEYTADPGREKIVLSRNGKNFFSEARSDAEMIIAQEDRKGFEAVFTKENLIREMDENGTFAMSYRQMMNGEPVFVNMKARRMSGDHVIIGVRSSDAQMKQKYTMEKIRQDQIAFDRMAALAGDYIVLYTVDPETDHYSEYKAVRDFQGFGFDRIGEDFFGDAAVNARVAVCPDDLERYVDTVTKENVLGDIRENGVFVFDYRLKLNGKPCHVVLKAAMVSESDGDKLIVGLKYDDRV